MDKQHGEFQTLAQLSLANDSDRLIEGMVCMFPKPCQQYESLFLSLIELVQFKTHLWDIEPLCPVAGLGDHSRWLSRCLNPLEGLSDDEV